MPGTEFDVLRELVARRRDVRRFQTRPIGSDILDDIFHLVEGAPSVGNSQPWRWVQVDGSEARAKVKSSFQAANEAARKAVPEDRQGLYANLKLAGLDEAPLQLAVFCDTQTTQGSGLGRQTQPEALHYSVACAIMIFWLAAKARGLGVGWVSILNPSDISDCLDVPASWDLIAYLCVGYPEDEHYDPELERYGWQDRVWSRHHVIKR
ncbi:5,6-dimethylbenzimidazole synthase [Croceicoccus sp. F390]|uniref:5,6-dimethylbenzimidazole synthase n=1 Tax=Croceicoccus esteveae TaxID=3075597 RepID=A0ABU2ZNT4_9SPHN|nr:5,6-dimethylbenzimidazole synthase [Croceicoccus sp. F390]MDT0577097.1 5,6-dimethylbenzimidazole synthase [Croceicoccus sp. F390]